MRFLDRLDDRVVGPKGQPPDPRRMKAGHWILVALVLAVVTAGFAASGIHNPALWPLAGMATGSLLFGGHQARRPPPSPPAAPDAKQTRERAASDAEIHLFTSKIIEAEKRRE